MADLIKKIKIKKQDGTFTDYIPIGAEAINVTTNDGDSIENKINKKPYYYNTVADMKADSKLKNGDMVITFGYYEPNDGGGAKYSIANKDTLVEDNGSIHNLSNNLKAQLYVDNGHVKMEQFGIMGNEPNNGNCNNQFTILLQYAAENNLEIDCMKKTYVCFSLTIPANTRINGNGCTFKKPNFKIDPYNEEPSRYGRRGIFSLSKNTSNNDPLPIIIRDCIFDGNCWEIWKIEDGYSQEQGSLITAFGNPNFTSKIIAKFYNIIVQNNASDGFHIRDHADIYIENAKSFECFRGGLTCTGGGSLVKVNGFEFNGNLVNDGIDFETDSGNNETNEYFLTNITINNDLDLGDPNDNALIVIDNMLSKGSCIIRGTKKGVYINNSHFKISEKNKNFLFTNVNAEEKTLIFNNCVIDGYIDSETGVASYVSLTHLYPGEDAGKITSVVRFNSCTFKNIKTIGGNHCLNTQVDFLNCIFDKTITGIAINDDIGANTSLAPRILNIDNCTFANPNYFVKATGSSLRDCFVNISNINVTNSQNLGIYIYRAIIKWNQLFFEKGFGVNWQTDHRKRMFGNRTIITNDTSKVPSSSFYGVHGSDTFIIMDETYTTPLAKFVYNDSTSSWDTVFNNI